MRTLTTLFAATLLIALAGCGEDTDTPQAQPKPTASTSPSPTPTPTSTPTPTPTRTEATEPRVWTYPGQGVFLVTPEDLTKIADTPEDFQAFIVGEVETAAESGLECPDAAHGVTVFKVTSDGFASGAFNACGGYRTLWKRVDGSWQEILGAQDAWDCADLKKHAVPASLGEDCVDY